jgi:hypothetical protein
MATTSKTSENKLRLNNDREMELLIHCARASVEPERADRMRGLAASAINWERLLKLAQRNGLSPLLYFHLNQICAASVPPKTIESLRDYFQKNSAFSLLLTGELVRLLKAFEENGIKVVPYKGPAIAVKLYGNIALRQFCDLDILVRESQVWKASELIAAAGFEPHFQIPENKRAAFVRLSYVQLFRRDAGRTVIELHWGIAPRFFGVQFDADAFWNRLEPMSLQGASILTPCAEDLLLMLCVHGAKDCWEKLEWVASIAELLRNQVQESTLNAQLGAGEPPAVPVKSLDWERVFAQARRMRCERMLVFGLMLADNLFNIPLPPQAAALGQSLKLRTVAQEVARDFCSDKEPSPAFSRRLRFHLRLKDSFAEQARHCVRLASTTTPVDWASAPLPGPLSFAYPLWRAVRLTRKYGLHQEPPRSANLPKSNEAA